MKTAMMMVCLATNVACAQIVGRQAVTVTSQPASQPAAELREIDQLIARLSAEGPTIEPTIRDTYRAEVAARWPQIQPVLQAIASDPQLFADLLATMNNDPEFGGVMDRRCETLTTILSAAGQPFPWDIASDATLIEVAAGRPHGDVGWRWLKMPTSETPGIDPRSQVGDLKVKLSYGSVISWWKRERTNTLHNGSAITRNDDLNTITYTVAEPQPEFTMLLMTMSGMTALTYRPHFGDVDRDGFVNIFDLTAVRNALNQEVVDDNAAADVNTDGEINVFDLTSVRENLNQ